jgi:class 3 adenylate cyclase
MHTHPACTALSAPCGVGTVEYKGSTRSMAEKIGDAAHGGQVVICSNTFNAIYSRSARPLPDSACALQSAQAAAETIVIKYLAAATCKRISPSVSNK